MSLIFIFITVLLEGMAAGIISPVFPDLMRQFETDPANVAKYLGYAFSVFALSQFFACPVLGMLSDRFGRRPVLLLSLFFATLDFAFLALVPSIGWLLLARAIAGVTAAGETVAHAYMVDISDEKTLSKNLGMSNVAMALGFVIGPAFGGMLAGPHAWFGARTPFWAAAALSFLNLIFGILVLPESLPLIKRRSIHWRGTNPLDALVRAFRRREILVLLLVLAMIDFASTVYSSIWAIFTEVKFQWASLQVGWSFTFFGICFGLATAIGTRYVIPRMSEFRFLRSIAILLAMSLFLIGFADGPGFMLFLIPLYAMGWVIYPALESAIVRRVPDNAQGEISGVMTGVRNLVSIPGPIFFTFLFMASPQSPGMPFCAAGIICLAAFALLL